MTNKELQEELKKYPDDFKVLLYHEPINLSIPIEEVQINSNLNEVLLVVL